MGDRRSSRPAPNRPAPNRPAPTRPAPTRPVTTRPNPSPPAPKRPAPTRPTPTRPEQTRKATKKSTSPGTSSPTTPKTKSGKGTTKKGNKIAQKTPQKHTSIGAKNKVAFTLGAIKNIFHNLFIICCLKPCAFCGRLFFYILALPFKAIAKCLIAIFNVYERLFEFLPSVDRFCFSMSLKLGCLVISVLILIRCAHILYWLIILTWCIPMNMAILSLFIHYAYAGYALFMAVLAIIFSVFVVFTNTRHGAIIWIQYAGVCDAIASMLLSVSWVVGKHFGRTFFRHKYKLPCKFPRSVVVTSIIWAFAWIYFIIVISSYRRQKEDDERTANETLEIDNTNPA